jgi:hypothetical protein
MKLRVLKFEISKEEFKNHISIFAHLISTFLLSPTKPFHSPILPLL